MSGITKAVQCLVWFPNLLCSRRSCGHCIQCHSRSVSRAHICHKYHKLYLWRKNCHVEKFWEMLRNFGRFCHNLRAFIWRKIEPKKYTCREKMTNMRSVCLWLSSAVTDLCFSNKSYFSSINFVFGIFTHLEKLMSFKTKVCSLVGGQSLDFIFFQTDTYTKSQYIPRY